jgi:mono/diheme cytochrome c family protein
MTNTVQIKIPKPTLCFLVIGLSVSACLEVGAAGLLEPDNDSLIAFGRQVYAENCADCHGNNLEGEPDWRDRKADGKLPAPPHDQTGHTWHHADKLLFKITKFGLKPFAGEDYESDMPVYDGLLTDEEIIAVLSFIKSTWPKQTRERHDQINAAAQHDGD